MLVFVFTRVVLLLVLLGRNAGGGTAADVWVTYPDRTRLMSWDGARTFENDATQTSSSITIDESTKQQVMQGFGAALTDSAAWLIHNLPDEKRDAVMHKLFGLDDGAAGISYLRVPMGASDMALSQYSYDDGPADPALTRFSIQHDLGYIIPIAQQAKAVGAGVRFLGTPWSPPAWMKTSGSLVKGSVEPAYYPALAGYFREFVDAYRDKGVAMEAVTVQNEPLYAPDDYPGTTYTWSEELEFVRDHLAQRLAGTGVKILTFDHNWDQVGGYPTLVMRDGGEWYNGSAWHCYAGEPSAMGSMHRAYPDKDIYLTECTGTFAYTDFGANMVYNMQKLFIGGVQNWAQTVLLWSLALDPSGKPHTGGCTNCRGVVTIDQTTQEVTYNEEFYSIAHFARFVRPGARHVASTDSQDGHFIAAAFLDVQGRKVVVVCNQGSSTAAFKLIWQGRSIQQELPASGVATVVWTNE